jgi:threonine dehydrogenase-like Zn-dependent dehydrogenase
MEGYTMRSVVFDGRLHLADGPIPTPNSDEALIRLRVAGICQTDLELLDGYKNFSGTLGHEFVGDVVEGPSEWVGCRVVGDINIGCGGCDMCARGIPSQCRNRHVLGIQTYYGAFADYFCLPVRNLHRIPDTISDEVAVFTEPLAAACQVPELASIVPTDRVILLGAGRLGMLVAQVVRLTGADLTVITRRERQETLLDQWKIPHARRESVPDGMADVVIDCTGTAAGFDDALTLVRPRGTIILKSTYAGTPQADLTRIVVHEIRIVGSRCGPFEPALRLLAQGLVDPLLLIDAEFALDDTPQALERASKPGVFKILLRP